jgi:uncharacterized protein (TIGR03435 family)
MTVSALDQAPLQDLGRRFEVSSVKENRSNVAGLGAAFNESPSGITILNATLLRILTYASGFQERDITGGPAWIRSTRFDIVARTDGAPINRADLAEMTMALLHDRYKLLVEPEFVERPVYALVLAHRDGRIGPGLQPSVSKCEKGALIPILTGLQSSLPSMGCGIRLVGVSGGAGFIFGARATMGQLAKSLSRQSIFVLGRPVIDATGLAGEYDFRLTVGPDPLGTADSPPSFWLHSALDVQLGLKLEERDRGPVEILTIRDVQLPSEN